MAKMRILITEYVISSYEAYTMYDLLPEAIAMVRFLGNTLMRSGANVYITINSRLKSSINKLISLQKDSLIEINPVNYLNELRLLSRRFDYILVIAPPKQLIEITGLIDNKKLLQPPNELIRLFSDKYDTVRELERCGIRVPRTALVTSPNELSNIDTMYKYLVIKPTLLAGSECVYLIDKENSNVKDLLTNVILCDPSRRAVIQEFINGIHGSISIIFGISGPLFYSVNLQLISQINNELRFMGGILPIRDRKIIDDAREVINKLFNCHPELKGYVGLDFVWNERGMYIVEVNPRPTTSIAGIVMLYPELGRYLLNIYDKSDKKNMVFLGDLTDEYAYYLLSERNMLDALYDKDTIIINPPETNRAILLGISGNLSYIYNRVRTLGDMIYDLK